MATADAITRSIPGSRHCPNTLPRRLKRKPRRKYAFQELPFVGGRKTDLAIRWWHVPARGGYVGGYQTGEAMAQAFLKFLRSQGRTNHAQQLTQVAESFMARYEQEGGRAMAGKRMTEWSEGFDSLRGQYIGFFNTVSQWLAAAAIELGRNLDQATDQELIKRANAGLDFDLSAYRAEQENRNV